MGYSGNIKLGSEILNMEVELQFDSTNDFGLRVQNPDLTPADLTGSTAWLILDPDDEALQLNATTSGDTWMWHVDRVDAQWDFDKRKVLLYTSIGGVDRVWGRGEVRVVKR